MKLLLLVQNEADVSHLDAAAKAVLASTITGVWVVFSPAITVNASEAGAKIDAEIEQLRTAEKSAAERADYEAAAGYKGQREGKELDRQKVLRDAWKTANEDDHKTKVQTIFAPFIAQLKPNGTNVRITGHSDHYDREQWVAMLNSLSGVWFKPFTPGSFVVAWPESVESSIKGAQIAEPPARLPNMEKVRETRAALADLKENRREELQAMHGMKRRALAATLNIDPAGKDVPALIDAILAAEAKPAATEPALAEY